MAAPSRRSIVALGHKQRGPPDSPRISEVKKYVGIFVRDIGHDQFRALDEGLHTFDNIADKGHLVHALAVQAGLVHGLFDAVLPYSARLLSVRLRGSLASRRQVPICSSWRAGSPL
jgi:hypothetical protein